MPIADKLFDTKGLADKLVDEEALVKAALVGLRELLKEGLIIRATIGGVSVLAEISLGVSKP